MSRWRASTTERGVKRGELGSSTVLAVFFVGLLTSVALGVGAVAGLVVGHRQVEAAADLAALAGAAAQQRGDEACAAASAIARRNHASMETCEVVDDIVTVVVSARAKTLLHATVDLRARARAGPVS